MDEKLSTEKRLKSVLGNFKGSKEELIPILQKVQDEFGYIPEEHMIDIARFIRIPESKVYGIATFYTQFRFTPIGKNHIMVCRGTACHVKGIDQILEAIERNLNIKEGETTSDGKYSLETVACIGCCSLAPAVMINERVYGSLTPEKIIKIVKKYSKNGNAES